ncbi:MULTISPECIES: DsrE family protein [unclassified Thioalkalivibrio]|uniref:DsrE family protein n=1 Tax=unclassified Thioalkalivibrio TaxID=2621013 RepID=UPI00037DC1CE|nr:MULTISPECIES: DsrE family protein [unclassified Thioalkalivibrio]
MRFIVAVTAGTDDPTRATLGMIAANVAKQQGHDVTVWLQGEAVNIANRNVYDKIVGHNMPAMKDIVDSLVSEGVPFWACEACAKGRDVGEHNFLPNAEMAGMGQYVQAVAEFDRSMSF